MARILVIDDEQLVRNLIVEILSRAGYEIVGAATPDEGLALLDDGVSLVISDIVLPDLSGFELLEIVRGRRPDVHVLLISGAVGKDDLAQAAAGGASDVLVKPFTHAELREAVTGLVGDP